MNLKKQILTALCAIITLGIEAKVTLPPFWSDHMVLQQQREILMEGKASPDRSVRVKVGWLDRSLTARSDRDGRWSVRFATPAASLTPYEIVITEGSTLRLKDVLIGEVWLCSGQSNMEMPLRGFRGQPVEGSHQAILEADADRPLRLFTIDRAQSTIPKDTLPGGIWLEASSKNAAPFSAVGYFFGDLLQRKLNIPIGLIHASWSASKIEAWMDRTTLTQFSEVDLSVLNQKEFGYPAGTPTLLYNAMISPLKSVAIRGVIWYQGESNSQNPELYAKLFPAWVEQWRRFFREPEMPVYYVQVAPFKAQDPNASDRAVFRECQLALMQSVPQVGMVFSTDLGSLDFIHPPKKREVGQRLAYWALAKTYGVEGISYCGPIYSSYRRAEKAVELTFSLAEEGLTPENRVIGGFEIAGADGVFHPAQATIINGSARVKVWSDSVEDPVEVRYCFRNYTEGTLFNNYGLPVPPFRVVVR